MPVITATQTLKYQEFLNGERACALHRALPKPSVASVFSGSPSHFAFLYSKEHHTQATCTTYILYVLSISFNDNVISTKEENFYQGIIIIYYLFTPNYSTYGPSKLVLLFFNTSP